MSSSAFAAASADADKVTPEKPVSATTSSEPKPEHLRLGPLVGIGFPRPLAIEGFAKIMRAFGVGLEYSFLPRVNPLGMETTFKGIAADLRIFPFRNAFFIGTRVGRQWLAGRKTIKSSDGRVMSNESMDASTWFVNPRMGLLHTFSSGITVGIDAGVQIPINPTFSRTGAATDSGVTSGLDQTLATIANTLGNKTTASLDLLRLGLLF